MPRWLCSPCTRTHMHTHTHTQTDTEHGIFHSWLGACEAVKKGEGGGSGGLMARVCVCMCVSEATHTHTHTYIHTCKCIHTDKRRLTPTRKIFVEITLHPQGGKLETGIICLRFFSLSPSLSVSLSHPPPTFLPSSPSTSLHQPPFGLLTREIKGRVCLIRQGEKPSPGGSEAVPGNKPREENRHLSIS